jgi:capsular polysaccharide transport system permease protein
MKTLSGVASAARRSSLAAFVLFSLISGLYWGVIASDRYVSEAHIYLQKTNAMQQSSADLISILAGSGGNRDLLLLRDHLLSIDMMKLLDKDLHLREHFSDRRRDLLSRLWSKDAPDERFQRYYLPASTSPTTTMHKCCRSPHRPIARNGACDRAEDGDRGREVYECAGSQDRA